MSTLSVIGATIYSNPVNSGEGVIRANRGWTGLVSCGNLLAYGLGIGTDGSILRGYRAASIASAFGTLSPDTINGQIISQVMANTSTDRSIIRMGANGTEQIPGITDIDVSYQGYANNPVRYIWNVPNTWYEVVDAPLATYFNSLLGMTTSFNLLSVAA